jgi:hypothetical protein
MHDGNYVIASNAKWPWAKQINIWLAYLSFYNPLCLLAAIRRRKTKLGDKPWAMQVCGMLGLTQNLRRTFPWMLRLAFGRYQRTTEPPRSDIPMRSVDGARADHAPLVTAARKPVPVPVIVTKTPPPRVKLPVIESQTA